MFRNTLPEIRIFGPSLFCLTRIQNVKIKTDTIFCASVALMRFSWINNFEMKNLKVILFRITGAVPIYPAGTIANVVMSGLV